jgi:hypothetical protein
MTDKAKDGGAAFPDVTDEMVNKFGAVSYCAGRDGKGNVESIREGLAAVFAAIPGLRELLDGTAVIVPKVATEEMREMFCISDERGPLNQNEYEDILSASPYVKDTP